MARYRIKQDEGRDGEGLSPSPYPPEEYWRETKPEHARDLDLAEIARLNQEAEAEESQLEADDASAPIRSFRHPRLQALISLLLILAFLFWITGDLFLGQIDFGFIKNSARLAEDQALASLREAVVTVSCSGGSGSGFNIREDGLIVTNRHVVEKGGIITVTLADGSAYTSRDYLAVDGVDLALIEINGAGLPTVALSESLPEQGDSLIFIGNPLGIDWTISQGIAQGLVRLDSNSLAAPVIYFSGPVRPGSSGSPLFNAESQVIGVVFASLADEKDSGLAIPVSYLISFLEEQT